MENEKINKKILEIWKHFREESGERHPILYPEFKKGGILFIGLNPSYNLKGIKKLLEGTEYQYMDEEDIERKLKRDSKDFDFLISLEKEAIKKYPYYKKFDEISKFVNSPWQHIDLFYFRETNQSSVKNKIEKHPSNLNKFAKKQLELTFEIITEINPKLIIVVNALASDIIREFKEPDLFKVSDEKFEKEGYHFLKINNKKYPILFSSMLTGRRALDKYSFERLKWHIKRIIKKFS